MNKLIFTSKEILKGRTIYRAFFNYYFWQYCRNIESAIDLASGKHPSYRQYLDKNSRLTVVDRDPAANPDIIIDLNERLPFKDNEYDNVFLFNAIYILEKPAMVLGECYRSLKKGGVLYLSSPFIWNEAREPHDYQRLTSEGLDLLFKKAGFNDYQIIPMGERFTAALSLIHKFIFFRILQLPFLFVALMLDYLIPQNIKLGHPCPLGYFCVAKK